MSNRELLQKQAREGFRQALRDPKTRVNVVKSINQGKDIVVPVGNGQRIKVTILGQHGDVIYSK